jgi:predicted nucleotidyltransferase
MTLLWSIIRSGSSHVPPACIFLIYEYCQYFRRDMKEKTEISGELREMMAELRGKYHVKKIGIFGSFSKGRQTEQSDLDLVVEFEQPIGMMAFVHLRNRIADRLGIRVDLVTPDGLHPLIRDRVMHEVVYV